MSHRRDTHQPTQASRARRGTARRRCLAAAGMLALLTACTTPTATPPQGQAATASPRPAASPVVLGPDDREAARRTARAAMSAYARPQASPARWWDDLAPLLSPEARTAYTGTDPASIGVHTVTGPATLAPSSLPVLARVSVPTDVGAYLVVLSRTPQAPGWLVERFIAPEAM